MPCPKCDWINEELASRYRRGRYRGWTNFAATIACLGSVIALLFAWFLSIGPATDRGAVPYLLTLGPAISIALGGLVLLSRMWLRKRIRPNRDYPLPPKLPPGGPTPLLSDPSTGWLEAEPARQRHIGATPEWIAFQVGRHKLPPPCCQCLNQSEPRSAYALPVFRAAVLVIPFCTHCRREWKLRMWFVGLIALGVALAFAVPLLLALQLDPVVFWMLLVVICGIAPLVTAVVAPHLTAPVRVKSVDPSRALVRLWFRNADYRNQVSVLTNASA